MDQAHCRAEQIDSASRYLKVRLAKDEAEPPIAYEADVTIDSFDRSWSPGRTYLLDINGALRVMKVDDTMMDLPPGQGLMLGRVVRIEWQFA